MANEGIKKYYYIIGLYGGALLVTLLLALFVIKPLISTVNSMAKENSSLNTNLSDLRNKQSVLNSLKDKESQLQTDSETVSHALPTQQEVGRLFIQLDSIAKISGGDLKSVSGSVATPDGLSSAVSTQSYTLPLTMPSYYAYKQFVTSAESALRLLSIDNVKMDVSDAGTMTINLTAKAYWRAQ